MHTEYLMGNEAIALGAIAAGVSFISGYPGTPSSEVLETAAKHNDAGIYIEWSVNEKAGLEAAAGAAFCAARALVTMKQVGLNVASDPLMSLAYVGIKGGMVVMVADDPGPISSQTEQDTRHFAAFSKLPCFDPSSAQEAYDMIQDAFDYSEKYGTPVLFRPTTRVCHGYATVDIKDKPEYKRATSGGFEKDSSRWVIFPRLSYNNHIKIEKRNREISADFSSYPRNVIIPASAENQSFKKGIATQGFGFSCVMETLKTTGALKTFKVSTPFPFPEKLAVEFLTGLDEVLCVEELDPVIERELVYICGKYNLNVRIFGKQTGHTKTAGENSADDIFGYITKFIGAPEKEHTELSAPPEIPVRPPILCAGCPHRASFYAVKEAMKNRKAVFCGDIGCYTLGNALPLDMVDTCLCMGAGINITQGIGRIDKDTVCFAFVGDSTFFASGITGVVNAVYNQANMVLVVLDNSTTAMTGHQPHPGTGRTMMGEIVRKISIESVLAGIGVAKVETVDPLDLKAAVSCIRRISEADGVKAVIFKSPCVAITKTERFMSVNADKCVGCKKCISALGCPAIFLSDEKVQIDKGLCTGCGICSEVCPTSAIGEG